MSLTAPDLEPPDQAPVLPARKPPLPFAAQLAASPHAFEFYQVVRMLEALHPDRPRFGRSLHPAEDLIRFAQEPTVIHAPSSLAAYQPGEESRPDRLLVHFFGLFGTDGPLPLHLTEYARNRQRNHHDPTFTRFIDLFHHRSISLFFRAWAESRPTVSFDRPEQDRFGFYVATLLGLGAATLRDRDAMPDLSKLHFAGHLSNQTRHAEGLGKILSAFFDMPVRVESFVGTWLRLPGADVSRLGSSPLTSGLGKTILLGARIWSRQDKFRIVFGPLTLAQYERLLPGGLSFHRLTPIVRNYAGDRLIWDVNLILKRDEVPRIQLGKSGRLGWTTWLSPRRVETDAADLFLDASADSHASTIDHHSAPEDVPP